MAIRFWGAFNPLQHEYSIPIEQINGDPAYGLEIKKLNCDKFSFAIFADSCNKVDKSEIHLCIIDTADATLMRFDPLQKRLIQMYPLILFQQLITSHPSTVKINFTKAIKEISVLGGTKKYFTVIFKLIDSNNVVLYWGDLSSTWPPKRKC